MEVIVVLLITIGFVIGGFLEVAILSAPGAFIRWLIMGRENSFKKFYRNRIFLNYFLGLILILVLYIIVTLAVKLLI